MKKATVLLLCIALILTLAACSGAGGQGGNADNDHTCSFGDWVLTKEATCKENGTMKRTCSVCGKEETAPYASDNHNYVNGVCTVCGDVLPKSSEGLGFRSLGDGTCAVSGIGTCTDTDVVIPKYSPEGEKVVEISGYAFEYSRVETVRIPDTVEKLGCLASNSLTRFNVPASVKTIDKSGYSSRGLIVDVEDLRAWCEANPATDYGTFPDGTLLYHKGEPIEELTVPEGTVIINEGAFQNIDSIRTVIVPGSVKEISNDAFESCDSLESVVLEEGVETIGSFAFDDCYSLRTVSVPDSIRSVSEYAFKRCECLEFNEYENGRYLGNKTNKYALLVDEINKGAASFSFPSGLRSIANCAFYSPYGNSLKEIRLPETLVHIGDSAFSMCGSLTSVIIPDSVTYIGDSAFNWCQKLVTVILSDNLVHIGNGVFNSCNNISFYLEDGIRYIPSTTNNYLALARGSYYTDSSFTAKPETRFIVYDFGPNDKVETIDTGTGVKEVCYYALRECTALKNVIFRNVERLSYLVFEGCRNLESITLSTSLVYVDPQLDLPSGVKITFEGSEKQWNRLMQDLGDGAWAFEGYEVTFNGKDEDTPGETDVDPGESGSCEHSFGIWVIDPIEDCAKGGTLTRTCEKCGKTEKTRFAPLEHKLGSAVMTESGNPCAMGGTVEMQCKVCGAIQTETVPAGHLFSDEWSDDGLHHWHASICTHTVYKDLGEHTYVNGKCSVCGRAEPEYSSGLEFRDNGDGTATFCGLGSCKDTAIFVPPVTPDGLAVKIVDIRDSNNVKSVVIPSGVTTIRRCTFPGASVIAIPSTVKVFEERAFLYCEELKEMIITGSSNIEEGIFDGCIKLEKLTVPYARNFIPCIIGSGDYIDREFGYNSSNTKYNDDGSASSRECWIPYSLKSITVLNGYDIPGGCFSGLWGVESITLPDGISSIGRYAFEGCSNLYNLVLPEGITEIGDYAFYKCSSLGCLVIPDSVRKIGVNPFLYCERVEEIVVSSGITETGDYPLPKYIGTLRFKGTQEQWEKYGLDYIWYDRIVFE